MSEWWTYRPSDFLMFSARSWGRLLEAWNGDVWPWHPALMLVALALLLLAARKPAPASPWIAVVLAAAWAWVGWAFHWERFTAINTGATWSALAFAVQAVLLLVLGARAAGRMPRPALRIAGLGIAGAAVVLYPLVAPLTGRGWAQAEVVGAAPDPTVLFTLGLLLALPLRHRGWLVVIPAVALLVGWTADWLLWAR